MILKNCEIYYPKLIPGRPNARFDAERPTWELEIRTKDIKVKKEWEAAGLNVKAVILDDGGNYWSARLRKRSKTAKGEPATPVEVVGRKLEPVDPSVIGNGTVANLRLFQYEGKSGRTVSILQAVQVVNLQRYEAKHHEDFEEVEGNDEGITSLEEDENDLPF